MSKEYAIDPEVEALVAELARPAPFETFSVALRRLLLQVKNSERPTQKIGDARWDASNLAKPSSHARQRTAEELLAEFEALPTREQERYDERYQLARRERAPSPDAQSWAASVPGLNEVPGLTTWKAICDHLRIAIAGDSARRRLQKWVQQNRPDWPPVPEPPSLSA